MQDIPHHFANNPFEEFTQREPDTTALTPGGR